MGRGPRGFHSGERRSSAPLNQLLQRLALQTLHDDERLAVVLPDVVNRADVGMIEGGGGARLAVETLPGLRSCDEFLGQEFDRHNAIQAVSSAL